MKRKPGPGEYDPNLDVSKKNAPKALIGREKRDFKTKNNFLAPGPNDYSPKDIFIKTSSAAFGFGTSKRPN